MSDNQGIIEAIALSTRHRGCAHFTALALMILALIGCQQERTAEFLLVHLEQDLERHEEEMFRAAAGDPDKEDKPQLLARMRRYSRLYDRHSILFDRLRRFLNMNLSNQEQARWERASDRLSKLRSRQSELTDKVSEACRKFERRPTGR